MKKTYWNVWIEIYRDGTVKAQSMGSSLAFAKPGDYFRKSDISEGWSLWFDSKAEADEAAAEADGWSIGRIAA